MSSPAPASSNPNVFTTHPHAVGETYLQHFGVALYYSGRLFGAAFCALVHALLPFMFEKTASTMVRSMVAEMDERVRKANEEKAQSQGDLQSGN